MSFRAFVRTMIVLCTILAVNLSGQTQSSAHFTVFDVPGAGTGSGEGTSGLGIRSDGTVVGSYIDNNFIYHGFLRHPDGTITTFDTPAAGKLSGEGTIALGLNDAGAVTGYYSGQNYGYHAFLRNPDGTFKQFNAPDGCRTSVLKGCYGTAGYDINDAGVIAGAYLDNTFVQHGFILQTDGTYIEFESPGAGGVPYSYQGTLPDAFSGLNSSGLLSGYYLDANYVYHGFLRQADGNFETFDAPGAGTGAYQGTISESLNESNQTAGNFSDTNSVNHGFLRDSSGNLTAFDVPSAGTSAGQGTNVSNINRFGEITGNFIDSNGVSQGYLRDAGGNIQAFSVPGAGIGSGQGTFPTANNQSGTITGWYVDSNGVSHGFLRTP